MESLTEVPVDGGAAKWERTASALLAFKHRLLADGDHPLHLTYPARDCEPCKATGQDGT